MHHVAASHTAIGIGLLQCSRQAPTAWRCNICPDPWDESSCHELRGASRTHVTRLRAERYVKKGKGAGHAAAAGQRRAAKAVAARHTRGMHAARGTGLGPGSAPAAWYRRKNGSIN